MKILILGAGYVGLSNALLLSERFIVKIIDSNEAKVSNLKNGTSPINEKLTVKYLEKNKSKISFSSSFPKVIKDFKTILIATPTDFDPSINSFNTSSIEDILDKLNKEKFLGLVVIRSTVPVGFTDKMNSQYPNLDIAFFPEFLREGSSLKDNLYPSRIICGSTSHRGKKFLEALVSCAKKKNIETLTVDPADAEAIKLFSNTFLALRVAFFNELDSFAIYHNLDSKKVIDGVSLDPRIGNYYNNPSFGYGGYCLPKDTRQLASNFKEIPSKLIKSIIDSNKTRKEIITNEIVKKGYKKIGIYKLSMKSGSDNWRESSIIDVLKGLKKHCLELKIYEPELDNNSFMGLKVENKLDEFLNTSELIVTNRLDETLNGKRVLVFTRDIYNQD